MSEVYPDESGNAQQRKGLLLVVEDDSRTLRLERFILEEEGFEVAAASTGEEALQAVQEMCPVLVLLDIGLPGMDGFAVCQRIRESSQVPIIIVTAEDSDEDKVRGLRMGADDYVTKPFSATELAARVHAVLRRYHFASALGASATATATQAPMGDAKPPGAAVPEGPPVQAARNVDADEYEGIVRLAVENTGPIHAMIRFVDGLRQNPNFHLLRLAPKPQENGLDIFLRLREPTALRSVLLRMEEVSRVEERPNMGPPDDGRLLFVSLSA